MKRTILTLGLLSILLLTGAFRGFAEGDPPIQTLSPARQQTDETDSSATAEQELQDVVLDAEPLDLTDPKKRTVLELSPEETAQQRAGLDAKIEQDLPQLREKWAALEAQGITYEPPAVQPDLPQTYSSGSWDNPNPSMSGLTMLDETTRLVLDIPYDSNLCLSTSGFLEDMQNKMNTTAFPIELHYTRYNDDTMTMYLDRQSIGSYWTYGVYVTACNIPSDLFWKESSELIWVTAPGRGKIEYKMDVIELYPGPDGSTEQVSNTYYFMVDVVVRSGNGMKAGHAMPLEYRMQVGDSITEASLETFIEQQWQTGVTYRTDSAGYHYADRFYGVISYRNVPGIIENGVALQEGTVQLPVCISADAEPYTYLTVVIGDGLSPLEEHLYGEWYRYGQPQEWFFDWLKDATGGTFAMLQNYREVDPLNLSLYDQGGLNKPSGTYTNPGGAPKYIPNAVFRLRYFTLNVDLSGENLQGGLPEQIELLKSDATFNFSNNQLTGPLPSGWGNLDISNSTLTMNLSNNKLSGLIPYSMGYMIAGSVILNLSNNQIFGFDPDFITGSVIDFSASNFECNFIPESDIQKFGIDELQYWVQLAANGYVTVAPTDLIDEAFVKQQIRVYFRGDLQNMDTVASELVAGVVPGSGFDTLFHENTDGTYSPYTGELGSASAWIGFVADKQGNLVPQSEATGVSTIFTTFESLPNALVKAVKQDEVLQVVVSGKNLQNILTRTFHVSYQANDLELLDAYSPTAVADLALGPVAGSNMTITEIVPGSLKFQLAPVMGAYSYWGGVAAVLKFRAKRNITTIINLL